MEEEWIHYDQKYEEGRQFDKNTYKPPKLPSTPINNPFSKPKKEKK